MRNDMLWLLNVQSTSFSRYSCTPEVSYLAQITLANGMSSVG